MTAAVWTAVGLTLDLEPGTVAGVIVEGREWALWRSPSGNAHVWEDRCPHRGMRLSFGFVRGDRLACLYHGWQYDGGGQCRYIPAHPELDVPATIRVSTQAVAESGGLIWAVLEGEPAPAPSFEAALPVRSLYVDAPLAVVWSALQETGLANSPAPGVAEARIVESLGDLLLVGGQVVTASSSALHIALLDPGAASRRRDHAQWAQRLRRAAEAQEAGR